MPDEPAWGQFRRVIQVNGLGTGRRLVENFGPPPEHGKSAISQQNPKVLEFLAGSRKRLDLWDYFRGHSIFPLLFDTRDLIDGNEAGFDWRRLSARWHIHHASQYWSPRVIRRCPRCQSDDQAQSGFDWYRRLHQLPGVEWCVLHDCAVEEAFSPSNLVLSTLMFQVKEPVARGKRAFGYLLRYLRTLSWLCTEEGRQSRLELEQWIRTERPLRTYKYETVSCRELASQYSCEEWFEHTFVPTTKHWFGVDRPRDCLRPTNPELALKVAAWVATEAEVIDLLASFATQARARSERFRERLKSGQSIFEPVSEPPMPSPKS
jgi:hypothetical protein